MKQPPNIYIQPLSRPATCPCCNSTRKNRKKFGQDVMVYVYGKYINARWRRVGTFCQGCYNVNFLPRFTTFKLKARSGHTLPYWIRENDCLTFYQAKLPFDNQLMLGV
jgi:hypothetical protein